ncbi:EAL domain-containing protein [Sporomusa aerivorans]|uniref:sensor domain-containing protein n=1 Tax=Sporomusa aerivorans TaxID=204936 RepID=UPI00352A2B6A
MRFHTAERSGLVYALRQSAASVQWKKLFKQATGLAGALIDNVSDGILITDEGFHIVAVNPSVTRITGYTPEELLGKTPRILKSGWHPSSFYNTFRNDIKSNKMWSGVLWDRRKDGKLIAVRQKIFALQGEQEQPTHYISIFSMNNTAGAEADFHDPLTNLLNRDYFMESLRHTIGSVKKDRQKIALIYCDLDGFKVVNDTLGHFVGDQLLTLVGQRLQSLIGSSDIISRLGGDEFAIIIENVANSAEVVGKVLAIKNGLDEHFIIGKDEIFISSSIGVAIFPENGEDADTLLRSAEAAMYQAKDQGKNNFQFYIPKSDSQAESRLALATRLHHAIHQNELCLQYQPQVCLQTGRIVGIEALLRWISPDFGTVPPGQFISIAEDTGLIGPIGEWVLREACQEYMRLKLAPLQLAVNLSARQFRQPDLVAKIRQILEETAMPASLLELELTETAFLDNVNEAISTLNQLKSMGVMLAIDDFGTGYSSLNYLKKFPVDKLKIDRSFIQHVTESPDDQAITRAVIAIARSMGLRTLAEGVETSQQTEFLRQEGCEEAQGYFFFKPLWPKDVASLIQNVCKG